MSTIYGILCRNCVAEVREPCWSDPCTCVYCIRYGYGPLRDVYRRSSSLVITDHFSRANTRKWLSKIDNLQFMEVGISSRRFFLLIRSSSRLRLPHRRTIGSPSTYSVSLVHCVYSTESSRFKVCQRKKFRLSIGYEHREGLYIRVQLV